MGGKCFDRNTLSVYHPALISLHDIGINWKVFTWGLTGLYQITPKVYQLVRDCLPVG